MDGVGATREPAAGGVDQGSDRRATAGEPPAGSAPGRGCTRRRARPDRAPVACEAGAAAVPVADAALSGGAIDTAASAAALAGGRASPGARVLERRAGASPVRRAEAGALCAGALAVWSGRDVARGPGSAACAPGDRAARACPGCKAAPAPSPEARGVAEARPRLAPGGCAPGGIAVAGRAAGMAAASDARPVTVGPSGMTSAVVAPAGSSPGACWAARRGAGRRRRRGRPGTAALLAVARTGVAGASRLAASMSGAWPRSLRSLAPADAGNAGRAGGSSRRASNAAMSGLPGDDVERSRPARPCAVLSSDNRSGAGAFRSAGPWAGTAPAAGAAAGV